jgi:hypothetical protein
VPFLERRTPYLTLQGFAKKDFCPLVQIRKMRHKMYPLIAAVQSKTQKPE